MSKKRKKHKGCSHAVRIDIPYAGKYAVPKKEEEILPSKKVDAPYEIISGVFLSREMHRGLASQGIPIAESGLCKCTRCKRQVKETTKVKFTIRAFETFVHRRAFCDDCMMYYAGFIENIEGIDDADKIATLLKAEYYRRAAENV